MPKGVCIVAGVLFGVVTLPAPRPHIHIQSPKSFTHGGLRRLRAWPVSTQALGRNAKATTTL
jgi:hypothetical protein